MQEGLGSTESTAPKPGEPGWVGPDPIDAGKAKQHLHEVTADFIASIDLKQRTGPNMIATPGGQGQMTPEIPERIVNLGDPWQETFSNRRELMQAFVEYVRNAENL